jgi:hypothetical protein
VWGGVSPPHEKNLSFTYENGAFLFNLMVEIGSFLSTEESTLMLKLVSSLEYE